MTEGGFLSIGPDRATSWRIETEPGISAVLYGLRNSRTDGPAILFGHANGLAAGSYLPLLELLGERAQVFAFDSRGHGGASVPLDDIEARYERDVLSADLERICAAVQARVGAAPLYYAGHSMSAIAALRLGGLQGRTPWRALTLFEPPLMPPLGHPLRAEAAARQPALIDMTRRRRQRWTGPDEMGESLARRPPFAACRADMLAAHCRATLRPVRSGEDGGPGEGSYTLCCPPAVEAALFTTFSLPGSFEALTAFPGPVHVVGSIPDPAPGGEWVPAALASAAKTHPECRYTAQPGVGHLMPLEDPEACADLILEMLDQDSGLY